MTNGLTWVTKTARYTSITISRVNEKNTGTLGLKVIKNEADGSTGFYFLSCFHVLFNENLLQRKNELLQNRIIETEQAVDIPLDDIRSPGKLTGVNEIQGNSR